jgi:glycoprotein-N-acetylgalactosamine 3-beta-galactosyltransferase
LVFSTENDASIPAIELPHLGEEKYQHMWQKIRSIWKYVAANYLDNFEWFLLGGDDMYFIMENLRDYLASPDVQSEVAKGEGKLVCLFCSR